MNKLFFTLVFMVFPASLFSQGFPDHSIHKEQSDFYKNLGITSIESFDSLQGFQKMDRLKNQKDYELSKRVFGYHPYWGGSNYLNYQWDLLSDLCYFSYEVDAATGNPTTVHDWYTSEAIDLALANDVKVHLCVTIFSGHYTFFNSATAQQTLIDNVIQMIDERGANGVNMDIEAISSSLSNELTSFLINLSNQLHAALPEAELSIAAPAVNWSGTYDVSTLKDYVDLFMIMAYDYYWNGSSQAGAVSPLYSMTSSYDYNFSKTISYYQSQGVPKIKLLMGVPYYGRQWPTQGPIAPSNTTASGTAYTYRYVKDNTSGYYSNENKKWEANSFSPYYSFENNGWNQCFMEDSYSLGKKYDIVNRRQVVGIGIWALGYDNGYSDLWDLISGRFTTEAQLTLSDTIFDSGGPTFNYYDNELYTYLITVPENSTIELVFTDFGLEPGYDSLWVYDGPGTNNPKIGGFSGNALPGTLSSSGNSLLLEFNSDGATTGSGWEAVYDVFTAMPENKSNSLVSLKASPNPFTSKLSVSFSLGKSRDIEFRVYSINGQLIYKGAPEKYPKGGNVISVDKGILRNLKPAIYIISLTSDGRLIGQGSIVKQ
ncbi:MAG: hypothetical protein GXO89_07495 [Chlorobi bacterium]|nr:hypothetical protein [Chlorobiota bacterium]